MDSFATLGAGLAGTSSGTAYVESIAGIRLPAFVTIVLIPLTLSITQGILWGFLLHALLYAVVGRAGVVSPIMWGLAVLSAGLLLIATSA